MAEFDTLDTDCPCCRGVIGCAERDDAEAAVREHLQALGA